MIKKKIFIHEQSMFSRMVQGNGKSHMNESNRNKQINNIENKYTDKTRGGSRGSANILIIRIFRLDLFIKKFHLNPFVVAGSEIQPPYHL